MRCISWLAGVRKGHCPPVRSANYAACMETADVLVEAYQRIRELVQQATLGLDTQQLTYRPHPESNSIAWLVWHLTRIQDDHISAIDGSEQVWVSSPWAAELGLPANASDLGQGDGPDEVAAIQPNGPGVLVGYHDEVMDRSLTYLRSIDASELDRIVDRSYTPPVSVGVRLVSVLSDNLQHAGQARYVRGMLDSTTLT